jgi:hypothetical protein
MSVIFSTRKSCYCAFCRSERKVYSKKNIGISDILASALGAGAVMFAIFQEFDPRVMLLFVAFLAIAEIFVQIRWRLTISCKHCGFDPVLYVKDTEKAVARVKLRLDQRQKDPASLLAEPLVLPKLPKAKAELLEKAKTGGAIVSKRI